MICNIGFAECIKGNCDNGYGTYKDFKSKGYLYIGSFKNGEPYGKGKLYRKCDLNSHTCSLWYEGQFDGVFFSGKGTQYNTSLRTADGIPGDGTLGTYIGEWSYSLKNGKGVFIEQVFIGKESKEINGITKKVPKYKDGKKIKGIWNNGMLVKVF